MPSKISLPLAAVCAVVIGAAACSSSSSPSGSDSSTDAGSDALASSSPDAGVVQGGSKDGGSPLDSGSQVTTITGKVISFDGITPIGARKVTLVDSNGKVVDTMSAADGSFAASGLKPPYDLRVWEPDATLSTIVYLGVSTTLPKVLGDAPYAAPAHKATIHIPISGPPCGTTTCPLSIATTSAAPNLGNSGSGGSYTAATANQAFDIAHTWSGQSTVSVHVKLLVSDSTYQNYWYTESVVSVTDGANPSISALAPTSISNAGTATTTVTGAPANWTQSTGFFFGFPGGGFAELASAPSSVLTMNVPNIVGATIAAQTYAEDPSNSYRKSYVTTPPSALNTASLPLPVTAPPDITSPASGAHIKGNEKVQWSHTGGPSANYVTLASMAAGGTNALIFVDGTTADLSALTKLAITVQPGAYGLLVDEHRPFTTFDAFVEAGALPNKDWGTTMFPVTVDP